MYGVIIWSSHQQDKAVIWCEDQGDLAFFDQAESCCQLPKRLSAGDLIRFDISRMSDHRTAENLQIVAHGECRALPEELQRRVKPQRAKIVPFPEREEFDQEEALHAV